MNAQTDIVVNGCHAAVGDTREHNDVLQWLASRKSRKFMGKQDELAVIATGHALTQATLLGSERLHDAAVYLTVGHIPFERDDIEAIATHSIDANGGFSMQHFSLDGIEQVNPLLTFRCLPNMPAYHISVNFDVRGCYLISYPGIAQFYATMQQACNDLRAGRIEHAIVGAVADQSNFLVDFYFARNAERHSMVRSDSAAVFCIERRDTALKRGAAIIARLVSLDVQYQPQAVSAVQASSTCTELATRLHAAITGSQLPWRHLARSVDHCFVESLWEA
jgi:3-oxoacyl-[acyl-carrier-protein] synthase II